MRDRTRTLMAMAKTTMGDIGRGFMDSRNYKEFKEFTEAYVDWLVKVEKLSRNLAIGRTSNNFGFYISHETSGDEKIEGYLKRWNKENNQ